MKKFLTFILILAVAMLLTVTFFSTTVSAATEYTSGYYTYTVTDGEATITDINTSISGGYIVIPSTLDGYPVTSIRSQAFYDCTSLKSVTIGNGVTSIGSYAFEGCSNLTSITIPDSVTSIGADAFSDTAYYNDEANWENGVLYIGKHLIKVKKTLSGDYEIKAGTKTIAVTAFSGCTGLTSITIPDSVTSIGDSAFYYCYHLTSITIPDSVTFIGSSVFGGCRDLESMTIPFVGESRKTASDTYQYPFGYFFGTSSYTGGVATEQWYYGSSTSNTTRDRYYIPEKLKSVTITGGDILHGAFHNCSNLTSVTIGDSVTSIGSGAFFGCASLTSVNISSIESWLKIDFADYYANPLYYAKNLYLNGELVTELIVPESITEVKGYAFCYYTSLTSVTIGDSVTSIGSSAFAGCTSLTSVTIGDSVTYISDDAFSGCKSLTSVTIGDSVTSIGDDAFSGCTSLTSIEIPDSVTSIGDSAFYNCKSLKSIEIPDSVTSIGDNAFYNCKSLTSVTIGDSVTYIGEYAFYYCSHLTSITIPDSVTFIGSSAFGGCSNLESMTIPFVGESRKTASDTYQYPFGYFFGTSSYTGDVATKQSYYGSSTSSLTSTTYYIPTELNSVTVTGGDILYGAFSGCTRLTSVTIGDSVTSIGNNAFSGCTSLTSMTIGDSVTSIGDHAFSDCTSLTSIEIPDSVTSIGKSAFSGCSNLTSVHISSMESWLKIDFKSNPLSYAKNLYLNGELVTELIVPESITEIKAFAFYNCSGLTSVTIGDSVTSIGDDAFFGCASLTSVHISSMESWLMIDFKSNPLSYAKNLYLNGELVTELIVPESITEVKEYAFSGCSNLTSIEIPDSVTSIGKSAFSGCSNLTSVHISSMESWLMIDFKSNPLSYAKNLYLNGELVTELIVPESITEIKAFAFYNCARLTSVTIGDSVTSIGDDAFSGCARLTSVTIGDSVMSIGDSAFHYCSNLTSVTIGDSVTSIGDSAFRYCSNLTSVTISSIDSWLKIDFANLLANPLSYAKNLYLNGELVTEVIVPESITEIKPYVFYNCSGLTSVTIGDSVTSIGNNAFSGCTSLTSVTIGDSVTSIGDSAFYNCSNLTSIDIPDSVTTIGGAAFNGCANLESITIPFVGGSLKTSSDTYQYPFGYIFGTSSYTGGVATKQYYYGISTSSTTYDTYYIPEKLKSVTVTGGDILYGAFYNCTSLKSIEIPDSVASIGKSAFYNCTSLKSIEIPDSVTSIGDYAFYNCTSLKSIEIPDSVTSIGKSAFCCCANLESITIPFVGGSRKTVSDMYQYPFGYIFGTSSYTGGVATKQYYYGVSTSSTTYDTYYIPEKLKSVTVTGGDILYGAFYNCSGLTSVTIGDSVTSIGNNAFYNCTSLTSVHISSMESWLKIDFKSNPLSYAKNLYLNGELVTEVIVPESITELKHLAFSGCTNLTNIEIPNSVTSIGDSAFYKCTNLTSVTMGNGVTSIGNYAFHYCSNLTDVWYTGTFDDRNNITIGNYYNTCLTDATWHYETCSDEHTYLNDYDASCENCEYTRTITHDYSDEWANDESEHWHECTICGDKTDVAEHTYDNTCDTTCNVCGDVREITHDFEWVVDEEENCGVDGKKHEECTVCHTTRNENTAIPATGNHTHDNACDTICNVCEQVREITHDYGDEWLYDEEGHWQKCAVCEHETDKAEHNVENGVCTVCGADCYTVGDVDGEEGITANDAIYLLYNVFFGDENYPVDQPCDFDGDNSVTANDAIYLLYHVFFGDESYPLV